MTPFEIKVQLPTSVFKQMEERYEEQRNRIEERQERIDNCARAAMLAVVSADAENHPESFTQASYCQNVASLSYFLAYAMEAERERRIKAEAGQHE